MTKFKQEYLCQWNDNTLFELYVRAWREYYDTAESIDGGIDFPNREIINLAVRSGNFAMNTVLLEANLDKPKHNDELWRQAKRQALSDHEREFCKKNSI